MSRYAHKVVDRRDQYYTRAAIVIATDALHFYTRAERGRAFQMNLFPDYEREQRLTAEPVDFDYEH